MNSEGEKAEDKFKFALLQVDKRLMELEIAIGEMNEKLKSFQPINFEKIYAIEERLDELEDLIMLENLGEIELKRFLENLESRTRETSEEIKKFEAILPQLEQIKILGEEVKKLADKLKPFESLEIEKMKEEIFELKNLKKLEREIEEVKEKIVGIQLPVEEKSEKIFNLEEKMKILESLREELTSLKTEMNELKEKTGVISSFPVEKIEKLEAEFLNLSEKVSQSISKAQEATSKQEVQEIVEEKLSSLPTTLEPILLKKLEGDISGLKDKLSELENMLKKIGEIEEKLISFEKKMKEIEEKIKFSETSLLKSVEEKVSTLPLLSEQILGLNEEFSKIKEELEELKSRSEQIANLQNEVRRLNERIKPLETQLIQRVAYEISDLRAETSKEIKDIKDKISGIITTKSEIDIKFLSSRLNSLKENVDYLLNRKAEFDMKIDSLQRALAKVIGKIEEIGSKLEISSSLEERLSKLEEKMEVIPEEIFENLKSAISQLSETRREKMKREKLDVDIEVKDLLKKISSLDELLRSEENLKKPDKSLATK